MGSASRAWCLYGGRGQPACRAYRAARLTVGPGAGGGGMQRGQSDGARGETGPAWGGWLHKCQRAVTEANPSLFIHWSLEGHAGAVQTPHLFHGGMASGCRGAMCGVCRIQTPHFL